MFARFAANGLFGRYGMTGAGLALAGLAAYSSPSQRAHAAGKSPIDCAEPVCDDKKDMFFSMMAGKSGKSGKKKECPLNRAQLGKSTWEFLHTTAAYYPDDPSEDEKKAAEGLINGLATLYACQHCREHLKQHVDEHPPDVSSRVAFSKWLCETHNIVNKVLDKPQFDCSDASIQRRWRTGCRGGTDETAAETLGRE
uniref:Sulfhydryl oxidase n=1 Tax=Mucochytrium quahogii TaxID=96639 RepID=A0A7S2SM51_9STRA|mmetsp:Transcript_8887/g.14438  ORF Transcript_8887/g.14438 Transcript_8887/m.14438 type:complete len:197 (+) Transcript_8887:187-777(+)|eukprot:CAMPEP_0203744064 /NCGR_PEP_ID=MMETSP0098-20131031/265_1 /ASSEMBLY_ACC=CAM_ASM_000208 /TAXON_ID=96639 /ORGANISM=" , Strain NY0313808BC1" /LENGTH=196 /DNA_ID=CAMNT_0050631485 /DNA_START=149 /DNA_END=739 /DNA_ORIENTATION=-